MRRAKAAILGDLAREEKRLSEIERAREHTRGTIEKLRAELEASAASPPQAPRLGVSTVDSTPATPAEKVKLFLSLFRGRQDVFPTRFVSKKTGRPGYAPACSNKWEPGLCALKTGGKCSDCTSQAFIAVGALAAGLL